jgi:hypothetical protein
MEVEEVFANAKHAALAVDVALESVVNGSLRQGVKKELAGDGAHGSGQAFAVKHEGNYRDQGAKRSQKGRICRVQERGAGEKGGGKKGYVSHGGVLGHTVSEKRET